MLVLDIEGSGVNYEKNSIVSLGALDAGVPLDASAVKISTVIKSIGDHEITLIHGTHAIPYTITIDKK